MKALSILQPWASLIAIGAKKIETRSWYTKYRGPMAIHVSTKFTNQQREICREEPFTSILLRANLYVLEHCLRLREYNRLPFGEVIATCNLVACCRIGEDGLYRLDPDKIEHPVWFAPLPEEPEISFGDYTPGRFAWILEDVRQLPKPIPAVGHQRL